MTPLLLISHTQLDSCVVPPSTSRTVQKPPGVVRSRVDMLLVLPRPVLDAKLDSRLDSSTLAQWQVSLPMAGGRTRWFKVPANPAHSLPLTPALSQGRTALAAAAPSAEWGGNWGMLPLTLGMGSSLCFASSHGELLSSRGLSQCWLCHTKLDTLGNSWECRRVSAPLWISSFVYQEGQLTN